MMTDVGCQMLDVGEEGLEGVGAGGVEVSI